MAPTPSTTIDALEAQIKSLTQTLYNLLTQTHDHHGAPTSTAMTSELHTLSQTLLSLASSAPNLPIALPPEVIQYVEDGRNPDIYTREFVELVQRNNQWLKGKSEAFASFRDVLAGEIVRGLPECRGEVEGVLRATGGRGLGDVEMDEKEGRNGRVEGG